MRMDTCTWLLTRKGLVSSLALDDRRRPNKDDLPCRDNPRGLTRLKLCHGDLLLLVQR